MIKAVIFDLDGVLTRSDQYHTAAWKETCLHWGIPFDDAVADLLRGVSRMESAKIVASKGNTALTDEELKRFAEEKNLRYVELLGNMSGEDVFPGVTELLGILDSKHIMTAVATSSKNAMLILEKTGLKGRFSTIVDGNQITHSKPDPEVFRKAADALGVPYENCLVVEDAVSGVEAALALGSFVAAVGAAASASGVLFPLRETGDLRFVFGDELMPHLHISPRPNAPAHNIVMDGEYRVTVLSEKLLRVERGEWTDGATQAVWFRDFPEADFTWESNTSVLRVMTKALTLELNKLTYADSMIIFPDGRRVKLDNAENLMGTRSTLDTNGSQLREDPGVNQYDREHIPLDLGVCSRNGVAVYDDSSSLVLSPDGTLTARGGLVIDAYIFGFDHDYISAVKTLYHLCGSVPVVPRWALGNWWCRYWPYTQREYLNLMDNFSDDGIPMSVAVVDMDWHHTRIDEDFDAKGKGLDGAAYGGLDGWTGYTWNERLFPDHTEFLKELHRRGMHVTLNLHPALGTRWYEKPYQAMAESMGMDSEDRLAVPFQIANNRFINNYLNFLHHPLENEGVDFWWVDWQQGKQSELAGLDPLWALNHYHYLDNAYRTGEGLILSRYAGVGSHRYPLGFSGDIHMDWEFLDYMPYFTATASNVGYGWWSHDIGGHHRGVRDDELYLRWLQFGVFSPINRIHCCPADVTSKEPWTLGETARAAAEKWFRFRHKLVPYLYSGAWKNHLEGTPLICPMYYRWPEENAAYEADHQYMFGDLLVAPITEKAAERGICEKLVWIPEGIWTDIFSNLRYEGGRWMTVCRDSGAMPVFAPAGAILPLAKNIDNQCVIPHALEVSVYNGDGKYVMFEENGAHTDFISVAPGSGTQTLVICNNSQEREFHVFFKNIEDGNCKLTVSGQDRPLVQRHNRCLQAIFHLEAGETAELTATWVMTAPDKVLRAEILKAFIQVEQDNWYKEKQWKTTEELAEAEDWEHWIAALNLAKIDKSILQERLNAIQRKPHK